MVKDYLKRLALAWTGSGLIFAVYTLAAQSLRSVTLEALALTSLVSLLCALVPSALAAALVRRCDWAMTLAAQVLTILLVGWVWKGGLR